MESHQMDMLTIILSSGPVVKGVLIALIVSSVVSWSIIFKKRKMIKDALNNNEEFLNLYQNSRKLSDIYAQSETLPFSPLKIVFVSGYNEFSKIKKTLHEPEKLNEHFQKFGFQSLERGITKGMNEANNSLDHLLSTLASIGSVTPFVGLFGTVWGIIDSFQGLAGGGATLDAVAPGIAEALIATAIGLVAAIPAVWFYNYFSSQNIKLNNDMNSFGQDLMNVIERSI